MALNNDLYTYTLKWSEEDQEHVATCAEFPGLSYLAKNPKLALKGIQDLVEDAVNDIKANNEPIPKPIAEKETIIPYLN